MSSILHDVIEFELPGIFKSLIYWGVLLFILNFFIWTPLVQWSASYTPKVTATPISHVVAVIANNSKQTAQTISSSAYESLSTDMPTLKPNKYGWPVTFERQKQTDPQGAYFATLNFGYGDFPAVYINADQWKKGGGHITVGAMPDQGEHYTVFTYKGTSTQIYYDRITNQVYSMVRDPQILS